MTPPPVRHHRISSEDNHAHAFLKQEEEERLLYSRGLDNYDARPSRFARWLPWILKALMILLLTASVACNVLYWRSGQRCIFPTDLPDSRRAIEYEQRIYTGALVYDPEEEKVKRLDDAPTAYFGPPSPEIEAAWDDLLRSEFVVMTDEEAARYTPELRAIRGRYFFEPDMTHSLHCLNEIRKHWSPMLYPNSSFVPEYHHHSDLKGWDGIAHLEHCMDRLRQAIMCFGDMTPSPMYIWDGFGAALGRTGEHTCRKWQPLRDWLDERGNRPR